MRGMIWRGRGRSSYDRILRPGVVAKLRRAMRRWLRNVQHVRLGSYLDDVGGF